MTGNEEMANSGHQQTRAQEVQMVRSQKDGQHKGKKKGDTQPRAPSPTKRQQTPNSEDGNQTVKNTSRKGGQPPFWVFFLSTETVQIWYVLSFRPPQRR